MITVKEKIIEIDKPSLVPPQNRNKFSFNKRDHQNADGEQCVAAS